MSYVDDRRRVHELMCEAGELIRDAGPNRNKLWACATDDLADAVSVGSPDGLREAFADAAREFWLRENQMHSVKAPAKPYLTVVKGSDAA